MVNDVSSKRSKLVLFHG